MAGDTPQTRLLAHAQYRIAPLKTRLRTALARSTLVERTAWHAGERLHMRTPTGRRVPEAVDISGLYDGPAAPSYPYAAADREPSLFLPAGDIDPVVTAADVTDFGRTDCVADPFLFVTEDGEWHLFFEVYTQNREPSAAIAHAESADGYDWTYDRVVLETDEHLSYPYVFRWAGEHYMIPDRWAKERGPAGVTLYRAERFPHEWTPVADLVQPETPLHDFSPFRWGDRWWALLGDGRDLYAYYSDELEAPDWTPHEANPVVRDRPNAARPGGRPLVFDDYVLAFYQDCAARYGERVRAFEIAELTPTAFEDRERDDSPVIEPTGGLGWNSGAMHQVDPWFDGEGWHCAVDGNLGAGYRVFGEHHWAIGIYRA
ncbi:hypothetical protein KTS45_07045 [Halomicroarcula limicola]|uniref:Glucosamine inositolphosphorylceramide transferase 1 N-terminal domain-containing protein n=1 Tax=Haloarcula limicola TaxID=1429915 RepID=A0A8J7Y4B3_9EURY|nr:hypothetical protein [Halomicroarcula limicola]MBV0923957.1 hypothetical protein [Halomicroarcula limicola]